jgi:hypothetical protein
MRTAAKIMHNRDIVSAVVRACSGASLPSGGDD